MSTPYNQTIAPCGTYQARRRHLRRNETCATCGPIGAATRPLAPCGTPAARKRHSKRGETCDTCRPAQPSTKQPCGTPAAWRRHRTNNEDPCDPCATAIRAWNAARRAKYRAERVMREYSRTPTPDLVNEIVFLLNAGEGTARILQATGYTGREKALRDRLQKAGHHNLIPRILNPWDLAA